MISFYPGPSKIYDEIPSYVKDAARLGVMSMNHRSNEFVSISKKTISLLQKKLSIPKNYTVFFTSSATECWEIIAQSWVTDASYHLYTGAFGQKWFDYTHRLQKGAIAMPFDREEVLHPSRFENSNSVICITQNETSNGTQVSNAIIKKIKETNPTHLLAVDATSSMAGVYLDFKSADIWFASVQKCFGLPAGMSIMICSPAAITRAKEIGEDSHYNSVTFMTSMMEKWQTSYTPNVLSIYLLMRVLEKAKPIKETQKIIISRYKKWNAFLADKKSLAHLVKNTAVHSYTVLPVISTITPIDNIKSSAKKNGFLLGEGYGDLKSTCFRIANFPAIKESEINALRKFLKSF